MTFTAAVLGNFQAGETEPWSTETHVAAALEELGCTVRRLQENAVRPEWVPALTQGADLLLWIKTWPTERNAGLAMLRAVEAQGTVTAGFHLDRWWGLAREHQIHDEPFFATQFSFTADGGHQRQWKAAGIRHHWLPPGVHGPECVPGIYRPELAVDVGFVGSFPYPHPEWSYRNDLVNLLRRRYRNRFGLWGRGRPVRGLALNDVYASVTVLVGDSCLAPDQALRTAPGGHGSDSGSNGAGAPVSRYWCVDTETEILTMAGWKKWEEVVVGDMAYAINPKTGLGRWSPVRAVNVYPAEPREMLSMESRGHSSLTTMDHRWLVESRRFVVADPPPRDQCPECGFRPKKAASPAAVSIHRAHMHGVMSPANRPKKAAPYLRQFRSSRALRQTDRIPVATPCTNLPTEPKYQDEFVELVAWLWTEGTWHKGGRCYKGITQSHRVNEPYVTRIRSCLTALFGPARRSLREVRVGHLVWREDRNADRGMTFFTLSTSMGREFARTAPEHVVQPEFIASLTAAQLRLFVETSIDGDGCRKTSTIRGSSSTGVTLAQKDPRRLDAFEMACALLGIATSRSRAADCWLVHVKRRIYAAPTRRDLPEARVGRVQHDGLVWCPTTREGTWLARRHGTVYFTGNSDRISETLGRGGFLIHPWVDGIDEHYTDGEHLRLYELGDFGQLFALVDHYVEHPAEARRIADAGQAHVRATATYTHRMSELLGVLAAETGLAVPAAMLTVPEVAPALLVP